jgi:hypothetical protein
MKSHRPTAQVHETLGVDRPPLAQRRARPQPLRHLQGLVSLISSEVSSPRMAKSL